MLAVIAMILAGSLIYFVTESIKPEEVRPAGGSATPANDHILAGEQLQLAIRQAELSQREVLLDTAPERLQAWTAARDDVARRVELLRPPTSDNQPQADGLRQLEDLTSQWLDSLDVAVEVARDGGADTSWLPQHLRESALLAQHLEDVLRAVVVAEERRYGDSSATQAAADQQRAHYQGMIAAIGFGLVVLFAGAIATFVALSVRAKRERLLAAERLRGEERLRRFVEALPQLVWSCDAEGVCTDSSPQWAAYTGRSEASQTGDGWIEAIHPDDRQHLLTIWQHSIDTQEPYDTEARVRGADGVYRWFKKRAVPIRGDDGRVETWIGTSTDISDVRSAQQALHEREAMLRRFIDAAPVAIAMFDRNMCYLGASRRFITDFDIDDDGLIGRSHYEVLPQNPPHWRAIHQRCLCGAVERSPGERFVRPDGTAIWLRWELQPWYDADGLIGGVTLFTEDISQRKQTEDALFREMQRAQVTLHSIGDAVITTDPNYRVEYLNPVAEVMTGWSSAEAAGNPLQSVFAVVNELTRAPAADAVRRCLEEGRIVGPDDHTVLVSRCGRERLIADTAAPIRDRDGTVLGAVLVFQDVSETRRLTRQLAHEAAHDALTGLANRRQFEQRLEGAVAAARHAGIEHALCYFDIDQFKLVNDTAGHAVGDLLLQQVRERLIGKFRDRDTLARLGGDEFAVLLEHCSLEEATRIAESIVASFREWRFTWEGRRFQIGASAGVVLVNGETASAQAVLAEADVACFTAKERGRNRIHVYRRQGAQPSPHHAQMLVAATLRDALAEDRFCLYGQPIVSLSNDAGTQYHYEVLLRMIAPDGGIILPDAFIPAAERFGLMAAIDRWVIDHAFRAHASLNGAGERVELAINLCGDSLNTEDFTAFLLHQFTHYDVRSDRMCFELTETAAIQNLEQAQEFVAVIRAHGSRFALDDFGTGLSSFRYLRELPADYLKIDGSFVRNVCRNAHDAAVVAAINEVGHILGIDTVAEYVHDGATACCLRDLGVDYAQGYAFGAPQPLEQLLQSHLPA